MKKYKITTETKINAFGKCLFRVEATANFGFVKIGEKGGWVESEANLDQKCKKGIDTAKKFVSC
jgi:hypothetical protein